MILVLIGSGLKQWDIELRVADMGQSQLPGECADVVISNCVINLCPDKDAVYEEAFRILKNGGRLAISDIVLIEKIDSQLHKRFQSTWAGCLGGAILEESYWQIMGRAGFTEFQIVTGPRQGGKTTLAQSTFPPSHFFHIKTV